jgi:general secretion pathway protein K
VVVVVLALVMLAAFFLSRFVERAMTEMLVEIRAHHAAQMRSEAYSALEATLAVLADYQAEDNGLRSPAQGWGDPLEEANFVARSGTKVNVEFIDESGKLPLRRLDAAHLEDLGRLLGLKEIDVPRFVDAFLGWTQKDHIALRYETDPRKYEFEDPPHHAPGRPIESFDELDSIAVLRDLLHDADGRSTGLRERMEQAVSLYDFPSANLNGASEEALILAGLDGAQVALIRDFNAGKGRKDSDPPQYFHNRAEAQSLLGANVALESFDTSVQCLRIRVTVREGTTALRIEAVITPATAASRAQASAAPRAPGTGATGSDRPASSALQYPFTVLALDESIELQSASSP